MQNIDIDIINELDNPKGLAVVHDTKNPSLTKIVDGDNKQVSKGMYTSRAAAEYDLYRMLTEENTKNSKKSK